MSDIFDDVDKILSGESDSTEVVATTEDESGFNDSELQDIMSEIENLEKDFDEVPATKATAPVITKTKLQEEIDREMEANAEMTSAEVTIEKEASVIPFNQNKKSKMPLANEVALSANGQMSLNLDFKVGEQNAKLCIDPTKGLIVTLAGVELCINEDSGCIVSMDNGMKFTIPLAVAENTSKKKAI